MKPIYFSSPAAWRAWLAEHHASKLDVVVGFHKRATKIASLTWSESVDHALCFGWIDGVRRRVDDERYTIRFTPRRAGSIWSTINVAKVAELARAGRMMPAGQRAFAARDEAKTGVYSFERAKAAALSRADAKRFRDEPVAWAFFSAQPPSYRRAAYHWVIAAKREDTRARRLDTLISESVAGRWIKPLRRR